MQHCIITLDNIIQTLVYLVYGLDYLMYTVPINNMTAQRSVDVILYCHTNLHDEAATITNMATYV